MTRPLPFTPVPLRARRDGWTPARQAALVAALGRCGSVAGACREVGLSAASAYLLRRRRGAEGFACAWDAALAAAVRRLPAARASRALHGVAVVHRFRGAAVGEHRRFDTRLTCFLLAWHGKRLLAEPVDAAEPACPVDVAPASSTSAGRDDDLACPAVGWAALDRAADGDRRRRGLTPGPEPGAYRDVRSRHERQRWGWTMRRIVAAGMMLTGVVPAGAQRPVVVNNPAGITMTIDAAATPGGDPEGRLVAMVARLEATLGAAAPGEGPRVDRSSGKAFATIARRFAGDAGQVHLLLTSEQGGAVCHLRVPATGAGQAGILPFLQRCGVELGRQPPVTLAAPATPAPALNPTAMHAAPPGIGAGRFAANWAGVEGVYFKSGTGTGVGGMVLITFEPVVLFKDGSYYEVDDAPLEDIDLAADRRSHPRRWGRWSRTGDTFVLTDDRGRGDDYKLQDGRFFKAFPAEAGAPLAATYDNMSGGGNSALGGEMTIAVSSKRSFTADGRFVAGQSVGAIGSGDTSGVMTSARSSRRMPVPGTYSLARHTLVMRYPDGREDRRFFAFASRKSPPQLSRDMIFIGDSAYITD